MAKQLEARSEELFVKELNKAASAWAEPFSLIHHNNVYVNYIVKFNGLTGIEVGALVVGHTEWSADDLNVVVAMIVG